MNPIDYLSQQLDADVAEMAALAPMDSLREFLERHARVKDGAQYVPYHFAGREALAQIVERIDSILGSAGLPIEVQGSSGRVSNVASEKLAIGNSQLAMQDASLAICGGAQFGKTVLMLNLLVYLAAVRFRNVGYYLPDDDLVQGIVDGKLRPDVLDQIPAVARLIQLGRTLNGSGRAVNRKGALLITDGTRTALAYVRGMGKVPTTFSMDVVIQDEKDDIAEYNAKFLAGRLTASDLRFSLSIGTQRYHGAGQNREFEEGTQHVGFLFPKEKEGFSVLGSEFSVGDRNETSADDADEKSPLSTGCGVTLLARSGGGSIPENRKLITENSSGLNPEEHWPQVCRLSLSGVPQADDPQLTLEGDFVSAVTGQRWPVTAMREGNARVYLADPVTGAPLDRRSVRFVARRPDREAQRKWSYRVSQLIIDAIDLRQIVAAWAEAVRDSEKMIAFCTDRLALPRSMSQGLDPAALQRAREAEPYSLALTMPTRVAPTRVRYAGLDMGDRCWFVVAETGEGKSADDADLHRLKREENPNEIPSENLRQSADGSRSCLVWAEMISAERVRERVPELCRALGVKILCVDAGPLRDLSRDLCFTLGAGSAQRWDEAAAMWRYLRAATVEFTLREGQGIRQKPGVTQDGAQYPLIACNREETIARVIADLQHPGGPRFLLPERTAQLPPILATYEQHLLAGSRQERSGDGKSLHYVDKCENHFLLATAYAALARQLDATESATVSPGFGRVQSIHRSRRMEG
ncbi:MAG: hypothetical protein B9S32_17355 [Verrucomicrobia bacterium Tous-C9LFEB]|nr:MAG: hypothetical protein B9S32_17355 [Verrucomicrobia bacterium Tous-C9LFEB]